MTRKYSGEGGSGCRRGGGGGAGNVLWRGSGALEVRTDPDGEGGITVTVTASGNPGTYRVTTRPWTNLGASEHSAGGEAYKRICPIIKSPCMGSDCVWHDFDTKRCRVTRVT